MQQQQLVSERLQLPRVERRRMAASRSRTQIRRPRGRDEQQRCRSVLLTLPACVCAIAVYNLNAERNFERRVRRAASNAEQSRAAQHRGPEQEPQRNAGQAKRDTKLHTKSADNRGDRCWDARTDTAALAGLAAPPAQNA